MTFENRTIIVKRKHKSQHVAAHGGAWKIAYADFVTAMMAFFLLMWLLSATTERQRKGLSDYFSPAISVSKVSTGGDGMLFGEDIEENASRSNSEAAGNIEVHIPVKDPLEVEIAQLLDDLGAKDPAAIGLSSQVEVKPSDEGWIIEISDIEGFPLFVAQSDRLMPRAQFLLKHLAKIIETKGNAIAISGHLRSTPSAFEKIESWDISLARAASVQKSLLHEGIDPAKVRRLVGHADRSHSDINPVSIRNNRIEIILLK